MKLAKVKFGKASRTVWPKSVNFCMRRMPTWEMDLGPLKLILLCCVNFTAMPFVPTHLGKMGRGWREGSLRKDAEPDRNHFPQNTGWCSADQPPPKPEFCKIPGAPPPLCPGEPGAGAPVPLTDSRAGQSAPAAGICTRCGVAVVTAEQ